jgi:hypothetical protein
VVRLFVDCINRQPALRALLAEAAEAEPDLDFDQFNEHLPQARGGIRWPSRTEEGRASLIWKLMQHIAEAETHARRNNSPITQYSFGVSRGNNLNESYRQFVERVLEPLFGYLTERVGAESSVLYVLERYVRRLEWFDRDELYQKATADPRKTEDVYDADLRRFLFAEGINMPFSQARSASGESDVLSELDTEDPLICELKVFDNQKRGKWHLGSGVQQAIQYATDYGKRAAYLVIVNISGRPLNLPSDGDPKIWPPYIEVAGVRVHFVTARAKPTESARKQGKPAPINITREDLVDPDATEAAD